MQEQRSAGGAKAADPLYDWWFDALPALFGAAGDRRHRTTGAAADPATAGAAGHVAQALKLTQQLFDGLFTGYLGALTKEPAGAPLAAFEALLRGRIDELAQPLATNLERAYGGLADAFGLAPLREIESAGRDLAQAALAQRRAQAEYLDVALGAARQGVTAFTARLAEMGQRGESVDTMLALMRLCAKTMDGAMHEAMQSPRALQASADAIRAGLRTRRQQQRIVAIASEALNVPTRAEVDEAFREIQELKRELRRLRKGAPAANEPAPAQTQPPRKAPAARAKAAARANGAAPA